MKSIKSSLERLGEQTLIFTAQRSCKKCCDWLIQIMCSLLSIVLKRFCEPARLKIEHCLSFPDQTIIANDGR